MSWHTSIRIARVTEAHARTRACMCGYSQACMWLYESLFACSVFMGRWPVMAMYSTTPNANMSTAGVCGCPVITSGAT